MATAVPTRPLRRDAERNRQRILDAARELFAERGLDVTLDDVARAAGVGVGTVYRRFADKEQLIEALFEERIGEILQLAHDSLEMEDPWEAFVFYMEHALELQAEDRGLKEVLLSTDRGQARVQEVRVQIQPLLMQVLQRAKDAGVVREDLQVFDLALAQHAIGEVASFARDADSEVWRRLLTIFFDGVRPDRRRPSPMAAEPLTPEGFVCAMQNMGRRRRR
jgi:AcrR family transcriptional regulator